MPPADEFVSYQSRSTVIADGVYSFLVGSVYGAIWGMVTPFYPPNSAGAAKEAATGVFRAAPPFSSWSAIPSNAAMFGSILAVQRISSKSCEILRGRADVWNELFGFGVTYKFYTTVLGASEKRWIMHNRVVGATVGGCILYASLLA